MDQSSRYRIVAGSVALALLAVLTVFSLLAAVPPPAAGPDAPADQFSAGRAFAQVEQIGQHVHVAGSRAADEVRDYIVAQLRSYGLEPRIQDAVGEYPAFGRGLAMAHVRNVVAVLPGTASTGRVFAVAHYDSVQVSFGANDDGAGVTTLLESARALMQGARPRNDIVFVFTEAEEACLCGAEAFVSQDALASSGGVALNFESRGSSGPSIMFETSTGNAGVVGVYADSVPYPVATSFAVEVYRLLPNDTDFSLFRDAGRFTGLNSAYIDGSAVYHSPEDRPSYMDTGSLQQQGANGLALLRGFGAADLAPLSTPSAGDLTYFPVLGTLVSYPGWLVWPVSILALLVVIVLAVIARRRRVASFGRVAGGFGLALIPILVAPVLAQVLWFLLETIRPGYANMEDPWRPGWYRAAVVALVATVVLAWYALLRRRMGGWGLAIGGLAWLAVLGIVLAVAAPGGSYLAALPAIGAAAGAIVALSVTPWWARVLALTVGVAVAVVILAPTVLLFFPALGLATGAAAALFATLLAVALLPLLDSLFPAVLSTEDGSGPPRRRRLPSALATLVALVLTIALVVTGLTVDQFDPVHPAPEQLMYALDVDTGQALWVSGDPAPGPWTSRYVSVEKDLSAQFGFLGATAVRTGPATAATLPAPTVTVLSDTTAGGQRTLTFTVTPQRAVRLVYVQIDGVRVDSAIVDGRAVPADELGDQFAVQFHAPPAGGLPMTLVLDAAGPAKVRVMDGSDGLDGLPGFTPRPAGIGIRGSHSSELVLVARTYTI